MAYAPAELTGTLSGADPGFADAAANDFRPAAGSALVDAGTGAPASYAGHEVPNALTLPAYEPPQHTQQAAGNGTARSANGAAIDIGAFER
ncbi:hypothetical protein [Paenibacillus cymbidii]|uniref:hypothetical protein n=1 Tax=Paenibacillus cymbidii TaxID=1639034 RepID=UPI0010800114|nr:hypothetical protein [Paenibacillus cymbidii]